MAGDYPAPALEWVLGQEPGRVPRRGDPVFAWGVLAATWNDEAVPRTSRPPVSDTIGIAEFVRSSGSVVYPLESVPGIIVGATGSLTGFSWGGVLALMGMHLVVATCGVVSFRIFLPLNSWRGLAGARAR